MYGYLEKHEMEKLLNMGFQFNWMLNDKDNKYYYIREHVSSLSKKDKIELELEDRDLLFNKTKNQKVLLNEEIFVSKKSILPRDNCKYRYYITLSASDLLLYLNNHFTQEFSINLIRPNLNIKWDVKYSTIIYYDNNENHVFELSYNECSDCLEELLYKFIIYLLKEKPFLLKEFLD